MPVGDPTPDEKNTVDEKTVKSPASDGGVEIKNGVHDEFMTPTSDGGVEIKIGVSDEFPTPASNGCLSYNSDPDLTDSEEEENVEKEVDPFKAYEARKKELEDNLLKKKADVLPEGEERETELKARAEELMGRESDYIKRLNELAACEKLSELKLESDFIEREKDSIG
ncbi:hypothetical protein Tco_0771608 [Tanacetum coccineum]|uniref:RAB6-interacting golgin n=1 Tax=Tanacetum coccineum TaxID=301880 RepID=A0ABQ4ZIF0_9ASTR